MPLYPNEVPRQDGPDWDDAAYGLLREAIRQVDRGEAKRALHLVEEAQAVLEAEADRQGDA